MWQNFTLSGSPPCSPQSERSGDRQPLLLLLLPANAEFDVGAGGAAFLDGDFHELADAGGVEGREGVLFEHFGFGVGHEEVAHVVTADAEVFSLMNVLVSRSLSHSMDGLDP